jgi:putative sigma-54 modulation protein
VEMHIRSVDIAMTDELRSYAQKRVEKLTRLLDRAEDAQLEVRKRPQRSGGEITAVQVTIRAGRHLLRAEEQDYEPTKAIDQAIDKMASQVRRFHDRRSRRQATKPERAETLSDFQPLAEIDETDLEEDGADLHRIARTKRFVMKPMSPDEAIEQMELLGHTFFVFFNSDESQINVVYRRNDGSYGLIVPDMA